MIYDGGCGHRRDAQRRYQVRIDSTRRLVELEWVEAPDLDDLEQALEEIAARDDLPQAARLLMIDQGTDVNPRTITIRRSVDVLARHRQVHNGRIAIAVSRRLHYGITNMLRIFAQDRGIVVMPFYEIEEARDWLGKG